MEFPNGRIAYFGTTSDSRKLKDGSSAILEWAISRIEDRSPNRNYIEFVYSDDPGGKLLPEAVKYTGSYANAPYYTVDFVYESRPAAETRPRYRAGSAAGYAKRLDRIDIKTSAQLVRRYALFYESSLSPVTKRSRLASIQECGVGATDCYRPLTFEWLDASGTVSETLLTHYTYSGSRWADINGDGQDDAVYHGDRVGEWLTRMRYHLSVGNGETTNGGTDIEWDNEQAAGAFLFDYNNDGKTDVAFGWDPAVDGGAGTGEPDRKVAIASWNGGFQQDDLVVTDIDYAEGMQALDVDGDGYPELIKYSGEQVTVYRNNSPASPAFSAANRVTYGADDIDPSLDMASLGSPSGGMVAMDIIDPDDPSAPEWEPAVKPGQSSDIDGDGRQDLLIPIVQISGIHWYVGFSRLTGSGSQMQFAPLGVIREPRLGDINGDGLADVLYRTSDDVVHFRLSKGIASNSLGGSFTADVNTGITIPPYSSYGAPKYRVELVDVNFDGMQDLFWAARFSGSDGDPEYRWRSALSTGKGFGSPGDPGLASNVGALAPPWYAVADQNGDGSLDIIMGKSMNQPGPAGGFAEVSDTISSITDSYGLETHIDYGPLITAHDWDGQGNVTDAYRFRPGGHVVTSYTSSDGIGGSFAVTYDYHGGMLDRRGRGFLGFRSRTAKDSRVSGVEKDSRLLGVETETVYRQDFPFTGRVERQTTRWESEDQLIDGKLIREQRQVFDEFPRNGIETYTQVYSKATIEETYGVGLYERGELARSVRTDRSNLDGWGNPRSLVVTHSTISQVANADPSGLVTSTSLIFENDTMNWCLGMPTSRMSSSGTEFRKETATWLNCRLQSKTTGVGTSKPLTVSYLYDDFGNVRTETVSASGETSRVTQHAWSTLNGRFLESTMNPMGHVTTFGWYENTGLAKSSTGPNGLTVEWLYDGLGNRIREARPDGTETTWSRTYCNVNCSVSNGLYQVTETRQLTGVSGSIHGRNISVIDALDRVLETRQPNLKADSLTAGADWSATRTEYDALGRIHRQSMPFGFVYGPQYWNVRSYDVLGRLVNEMFANGGDRAYSYDGLVTTTIETVHDEIGGQRTIENTRETDAKGRVVRVTDALFNSTTYAYDGFDNLTDTWAPGNAHIHIEYDDRGFKQSVDDPDMGTWTYGYNAFGELETQTDAKGQIVTLAYDSLGRLRVRTEPEGTTTWTYDGVDGALEQGQIGKLYDVVQDVDGVVVYRETTKHDSLGRLQEEVTKIAGTDYQTNYRYDEYGRLRHIQYPESLDTRINKLPRADIKIRPSSGEDETITKLVLPGSVILDGTDSADNSFPEPLQFSWAEHNGLPVDIMAGVPVRGSAIATFSVPGFYKFRLTIDDGAATDEAISEELKVVPSKPGLSLTEITTSSARISWSTPYGATASTVYEVREATSDSRPADPVYSGSALSMPRTELDNGKIYRYWVRACEPHPSGELCSDESKATLYLMPGKPGTFSVNPSTTDTGDLVASWGASSGRVTGYRMEESGPSPSVLKDLECCSESFKRKQGTWTYHLYAYNGPTSSVASDPDSVTVVAPAALGAPAISYESDMTGDFTITWNSGGSGVDRYELQRRVTIGSVTYGWTTKNKGTSRSHSESDVDTGKYEFRVRTCKYPGCGNWSSIRSITISRPQWDKCPPNCPLPLSTETGPAATESTNHETTSDAPAQDATPNGGVTELEGPGDVDATIADETDSAAPGADASASSGSSIRVSADDRKDFRLMPPPRPYDLARARGNRIGARVPQIVKVSESEPGFEEDLCDETSESSHPADESDFRFGVCYDYSRWGHLWRVRREEPFTVDYWTVDEMDYAGHVARATYGNGYIVLYQYDAASGLVTDIESNGYFGDPEEGEDQTLRVAQNLRYKWDTAGNLVERHDGSANLTERFFYDTLNRLDHSTLDTPVLSGTNLDLVYDLAGNIMSKTGAGTYGYNSPRPHAITDLHRPDGSSETFTYDSNGNLISGAGRSVEWTSYNYPESVAENGKTVRFKYGPNRQRIREIGPGYTLTTVNAYFEKVEEDGATAYKHYIRAGGRVIAIHSRRSDYQHTEHYLHRDHLGSIDVITDEDGNVSGRMSFDAFGQRRVADTWEEGFPISTELDRIRKVTTRGYTGHQMVDDVNLIHMGGRIYDPELGRFLSPDPFVAAPRNTQAYNRYSYVYNNPLSFTDPSGFIAIGPNSYMANKDQPTQDLIDKIWDELTPQEKKQLRQSSGNSTVLVCYSDGKCELIEFEGSEVTVETAAIIEPAQAFLGNVADPDPTPAGIRDGASNTDLGLTWKDGKLTGEVVWGCSAADMTNCQTAVAEFNAMVAANPTLNIKNTLVDDSQPFTAHLNFYTNPTGNYAGWWDPNMKALWTNLASGLNQRTLWHEYGHAIGLGHQPNSSKNFMSYYGVGLPRKDVGYILQDYQIQWLKETYSPSLLESIFTW